MSFKRDGDDGSQLSLLKKRRVAELLAEDIPDDEAILMSSGRYACTVCHYRPVFDTVDMLTIHRAGRKHQHAIDHHYAKKRELALLVQKRYHESQLKREASQSSLEDPGPAPLLQKVEEAKRHVLLKEAPYNPCHSHRNESPSSKPKGKLFFQGIHQMHMKSLKRNTANQGTPAHDSTDQVGAMPNTSMKPGKSFISPLDGKEKPRVDVVRQTPAPDVSRIEIKPYIPKSKRGKASTTRKGSPESRQNDVRGIHATTSKPGTESRSNPIEGEDVAGHGVANPKVQYISEYQNAEQLASEASVPADHACDGRDRIFVRASSTHGPKSVGERMKKEKSDPETVAGHCDRKREVLLQGSDTYPMKFVNDRKNAEIGIGLETRTPHSGTSRDINAKDNDSALTHFKSVNRQKEQMEDHKEDAPAPLPLTKPPHERVMFLWNSNRGSLRAEKSKTSRTKRLSNEGKRETESKDEKGDSSQSGPSHHALQLFHDRQKSRLRAEEERAESNAAGSDGSTIAGKRGRVQEERLKNRPQRSEARKKELQRYLELTSAGWVQDRGGQWVKGQDVEFDSDEEPPTG